jgi:hypothetical protein
LVPNPITSASDASHFSFSIPIAYGSSGSHHHSFPHPTEGNSFLSALPPFCWHGPQTIITKQKMIYSCSYSKVAFINWLPSNLFNMVLTQTQSFPNSITLGISIWWLSKSTQTFPLSLVQKDS